MSKAQALVIALPYGLIVASLIAAGCGVDKLAWLPALGAGCALINPGAGRSAAP